MRKVTERIEEYTRTPSMRKNTNVKTAKILAVTIEAKDPYTRGHCNRVRALAARIASYTDLPRESIEMLEYGALLHDIGKIGIPEHLLNKDGRLNAKEMKSFQLHTVIGENILKTVEFFRPCLKIIRHHHERFDGGGYPDGLSGSGIDLSARIVALSDAFDAMTSTRPYRKALALDAALSELEKGRERQFDPFLVDIFIEHDLYCILTLRDDTLKHVPYPPSFSFTL